MAKHYVAVVHLPARSGITADEVQNVWAFQAPGAVIGDDTAAIHTALEAFYVGNRGIFSPELSSNPLIKIYDAENVLTASPPNNILGPPIEQNFWSWGGGFTGTAQVEECAITLSFHADLSTLPEYGPGTRPRATHRGRVYLGPLNTASLTTDSTTGRTLIGAGTPAGIATHAATLRSASGCTWCVWSRKNRAFYPVTGGWVDNAFDTQRRRGPDATARSTF